MYGHTSICMATPNICIHIYSSLAISYKNLKIFTKEWWWNTLKTIFKQLKQFFIFSLNTQYMYGHAFTYVLFHLHLLEFIYLKLEFFSMLQYMCPVSKYCPTFLTLINILTSQYDTNYQYMYGHAFTTPKPMNFGVYLMEPRKLVLVNIWWFIYK